MPSNSPPPALTEPQLQATNDFVRTILGRLKNDGGVHAETAVAAAAGLAGTYLLRSCGLALDDREAGSAVVCEAVDTDCPTLIGAIGATLASLGLALDPTRLATRTPPEHSPQLTLPQIQLMFGVPYRNTIRSLALSERNAAFASAVAAARIIKDCAPVLDPHVAFAVAAAACNEGARTVPIRVPGDGPVDDRPRRPWYKFW